MSGSMEVTAMGGARPVASVEEEAGPSLIRLALEKGVEVGVLERLVALQERVTERNARESYFMALSAFQEECPEIRKSKKASIATKSGANFSYSYAPLEEISRVIRPVLKKHGLSYSWDTLPGDGVLNVVCVLRHIEGHSERSTFPVPLEGGGRMSAAQANGAALSYGKRQSLVAVLGLTTADEDVDGATGKPKQPPAPKVSPSQAADIEALADEVGANKTRFLAHLGFDSFADITTDKVKFAISELEKKRRPA